MTDKESSQAAPVAAEPTLYQYRMRAGWISPARWSEWSNCTALSASDYERMPVMHDYHYEVRRLYLITPQAAFVAAEPLTDAEIIAIGVESMSAKPGPAGIVFARAIEAAVIRAMKGAT